MNKIIRNSAICLRCNEEIVSEYRHDFKWCSCHTIAVDGGLDYLRRAYNEANPSGKGWEDTSIIEEVEEETKTNKMLLFVDHEIEND